MPQLDETTRKDIVFQAIEEYEMAVEFRKPRIKKWHLVEDFYAMKVRPALIGRFNIPLPIMSGFIHALKSKIDDSPVINFSHTEEADYKKAQKITAAWQTESSNPLKNWSRVDRGVKQLAIFSGVGIYAIGSDTPYDSYIEWVDHYDFLQDPQGGAILENHSFCGRDGIMKTKFDIFEGAKGRVYESSEVRKIIAADARDERGQETSNEYQSAKENRYAALDLALHKSKFIKKNTFKFIEWCTTFKGVRYYVVFNYEFKVGIRVEPLESINKSNLYPYVRWACYDDPMNPWPVAPAEEMIPVCDAIQTLVNQAFENRNKINWEQRAYDPNIFNNPKLLEYIPDGLVPASVPAGRRISDGIFQFKTERIEGTIELVNFFDGFSGQKTGITPGAQGVSEKDKKVGIYFGELQQVADRLGLINHEYRDAWQMLGLHYKNNLSEKIDEPMLVRIIGEKGVENEELSKDDLTPSSKSKSGKTIDFDITIKTSNAELEADAAKQLAQSRSLEKWAGAGIISKRWAAQQELLTVGFTSEQIKEGMDLENEGNREILSEAAQENQDLGQGRIVPPNRGATAGHVERHLDFMLDTSFSKDPKKQEAIVANIQKHIDAEIPFVIENKKRAYIKQMIQMKMAGAMSATNPEDEAAALAEEKFAPKEPENAEKAPAVTPTLPQ